MATKHCDELLQLIDEALAEIEAERARSTTPRQPRSRRRPQPTAAVTGPWDTAPVAGRLRIDAATAGEAPASSFAAAS